MKIGYQGDVGSNSEAAAINIASRLQFCNPEFVPLICSKNVIDALVDNKIDFAVVAVENSIAGIVDETKNALNGQDLSLVETEVLPIHHCLFKKNADCKLEFIASHPQALAQTRITRQNMYSGLQEIEIEDTAIGAVYLANGDLKDNVGVLCRKNAGEMYGLYLEAENIEDDKNNYTTFHMLQNK